MNEKKADHQDLYQSLYDKAVLAVQLQVVSIQAANSGALLLRHATPEWVEEAANEERIMLSQQPDSNLAHLWVETPDGGQLLRPNEWLVNLYGKLYIMPDRLFRYLFASL